MSAVLYWKSTCTTARAVRAVLRARHPELGDRNYAKDALTADEIRALVVAAGSVGAVLNRTHATAKAHGWPAHPPETEMFVRAAVAVVVPGPAAASSNTPTISQ